MKKEVALLAVLFVISVFTFALIHANEVEQVAKAYECVENRVNNSCSTLKIEEKTFAVLSVGKCYNELINDAILLNIS